MIGHDGVFCWSPFTASMEGGQDPAARFGYQSAPSISPLAGVTAARNVAGVMLGAMVRALSR